MEIEKIKRELTELKEPKYRFEQIYKAVFKNLVFDFEKITVLSKDLRENLGKKFKLFSLKLDVLKESRKKDVYKALFNLEDGNQVESVLMLSDDRRTVCISSQVGCPMSCQFCATGQMGFTRNLSAQEIFDQVLWFAELVKNKLIKEQNLEGVNDDNLITNVVLMGMGEPFLNYENSLKAIRILNDHNGFNLGQRRMSISTCGILPGIKKFIDENLEVNLAISLHTADDKLRSELMLVNKEYPIEDLMLVCREYVEKTRRKLFFEYIMMKGVNDSKNDAIKLARVLGHTLFHVNLIKYNFVCKKFEPSSMKTIISFQEELLRQGIHCTIRKGYGEEIWAGCGQLKIKNKI